MLKRWMFAALFLSAEASMAGKVLFDGRIDAQGTSANGQAVTTGQSRTSFRYLLKTARIDATTDFNDKTSARIRFGFTQNLGNQTVRDTSTALADYFLIKHKLNDNTDITLGKFHSDMGGFEHANPSADVHYFSQNNTGVLTNTTFDTYTKTIVTARSGKSIIAASAVSSGPGVTSTPAWTWSGTGIVKSYAGVKLSYKIAGQEIVLHNANLSADDIGNTSQSTQTRTLVGAVYKGNFMEKSVQPWLSYHDAFLPGAPSGSIDAKATYTAAGVRGNIDNNLIDLEYLSNVFKDRTLVTGNELQTDSIITTQLSWRKTWGLWTPTIKYEKSELTAAGTKVFDVTGYNVAFEWRPVSEENFRYHLAYNNRAFAPTNSDSSIVSEEVMLGMRIFADFLK